MKEFNILKDINANSLNYMKQFNITVQESLEKVKKDKEKDNKDK